MKRSTDYGTTPNSRVTDCASSSGIDFSSIAAESQLQLLRELLVAPVVKKLESRLGSLEHHVQRTLEAFTRDVRGTLEMYERYVQEELDSLNQRMRDEGRLRAEAGSDLRSEFERHVNYFEGLLTGLRSSISQTERLLREEVRTISKNIDQGSRDRASQTNLIIEKTREEVRSHHLDRVAVASLLAEVSRQIGVVEDS